MNIARFEPWSFVDLLSRDLDRIAGQRLATDTDKEAATHWVPAVDIVEESGRFLLRADVPGVKPDDIDVSMDAGLLSLSGVRHAEDRSEVEGMQRVERSTGRFLRRFTLPDTANADGITAKSSNGILEVAIPKLPEIQARRIAVEAA